MVDVPGGHPEPGRIGLLDIGSLFRQDSGEEDSVDDKICDFDSAVEDVVAETNAPRESLCKGVDINSNRGAVLLGVWSIGSHGRYAIVRLRHSLLTDAYRIGSAL